MKKKMAALCLVLVLTITGCGKTTVPPGQEPISEQEKPQLAAIVDLVERDGLVTASALEEFFKDETYTYYFPSIRSEYIICTLSDGTTMPIKEALAAGIASIADLQTFGIGFYRQDADGNYVDPSKTLLALQYLPYLPIAQTEPTAEHADFAYPALPEIEAERYADRPELQVFADYAENELHSKPDQNWEVFVHYYDTDKTVGMVQFQYFIGEIGTNKSILFSLNNGKVDLVYHSCLEDSTDEQALQNRVRSFKQKYRQEPYRLQTGERFESETTDFTFYYNTEDLVYCYTVFFSDDRGFIYNDYGTACFIDENGNAVQTR